MNKVRRSKSDRWIAGVCGGLGKYLGLSPALFRVIFIILGLPGGLPGVIPYLILWLAIPEEA